LAAGAVDPSFRPFAFGLERCASAAAAAGPRAPSSWRDNASVVALKASILLVNTLPFSTFDVRDPALASAS
jgi:hypothetical protein